MCRQVSGCNISQGLSFLVLSMAVPVLLDCGSALPFMEDDDDDFTDTEPPPNGEDDAEDEDRFYIPTWVGKAYGFRDFGRP